MHEAVSEDYWTDAQRPLTCLLFLLPWIVAYESGVLLFSDLLSHGVRNGADGWMRAALPVTGAGQVILLPLIVVAILLTWHIVCRHPWKIRLETQVGMLAESLLLAVALVAAGQLHQLLFMNLPPRFSELRLLSVHSPWPQAVSCIGAGVYEEVLFRLMLLPAAFLVFRMFEFSARLAAIVSAVLTSVVFAIAHHIGPAAEAFNLFAFSFRAAAGLFFASVFFLRGFGIAVGCHATYDLIVGGLLATDVS